jgi:hypothetical protein
MRLPLRLAVRMKSRAEDHRRRGLQAKQRAAHTTDLSLKEAFKDVARHWLALAEREDWLDQHYRDQRPDKNREPETSAGETSGRLPRARK